MTNLVDAAPVLDRSARRRQRRAVRSVWRQPVAIAGIVIVAVWVVVAIFAPLIATHDPLQTTSELSVRPSSEHLFGTDLSLLRWPRGVGLALLDAIPPLRRSFTRAMLYGA